MSPMEHIFVVLDVAIEKNAITKGELRDVLASLSKTLLECESFQELRLQRISERLARRYDSLITEKDL